jgi:TRAP-type C4-dicarboxylate transport system permease small subunit
MAAFLLTIGIATLQIISRYLPKRVSTNLLWTGELATNMLIFVIFFGAVLAEIEGGQLSIGFLRDQIEARIGSIYELFVLVSSLAFTLPVVYGGIFVTQARWNSTGLLLPWFRVGYLYLFLTLAFAFLSVIRIWRAGTTVRKLFEQYRRSDRNRRLI